MKILAKEGVELTPVETAISEEQFASFSTIMFSEVIYGVV